MEKLQPLQNLVRMSQWENRPGTGSTDLVREVTGLLKSMSSVKAVTVKIRSVREAQLGAPGEVALLDGGATHGLRQAYPEEEPDLTPTTFTWRVALWFSIAIRSTRPF